MKELTPKEKVFVAQYLVNLNGSEAVREAGYKTKRPDQYAYELLRKPEIQSAIQAAMNQRAKRVELTADFVLGNLLEINERCLQRVPVMAFDKRVKEMVQVTNEEGEGVWQFDANGALRANELMGKHLKLFTDKTELTGKDGGPLEVQQIKGMTDEQLQELIRKAAGTK